MQAERAVRDVLPGHPLARHIDDFLADLANAILSLAHLRPDQARRVGLSRSEAHGR